jgi:hypothetical protein
MKRSPALGLGVSLAVLTGGASSALANSSLSLGWRATERRILVNYGSGDEPSNFQKFLHDDNSKSTVRNSYQEWARFDLAAETSLGQHFKLGTRLSGGRSRLKLADHNAPSPVKTICGTFRRVGSLIFHSTSTSKASSVFVFENGGSKRAGFLPTETEVSSSA